MKPIYIPTADHQRLTKIINELLRQAGKAPAGLQKLQEELGRATVMPADDIPPTVVTLNSSVRLRDLQSGEVSEWILVMPEYADADKKRLSILAPIGTGILGFSEGDEIEWETPGGVVTLLVEKVQHGAFTGPSLLQSLYG